MKSELPSQSFGEAGESPEEFLELGRLAERLAYQVFAIDQLEGGLAMTVKGRMQRQVGFGGDSLTGSPSMHLVGA